MKGADGKSYGRKYASAAHVEAFLVDRGRTRAGAAIAEQRARQFVEHIHHAGNGIAIDAGAADRHMGGLDAEFGSAGCDLREGRLAGFFLIGPVADDDLEAERGDLVEIGCGDLAGYGILLVNLSDLHHKIHLADWDQPLRSPPERVNAMWRHSCGTNAK